MPSTPTTIEDLQQLCESTERMIAELTGKPPRDPVYRVPPCSRSKDGDLPEVSNSGRYL